MTAVAALKTFDVHLSMWLPQGQDELILGAWEGSSSSLVFVNS